LGHAVALIQPARRAGCVNRPHVFVGIAAIVRAVVGDEDGCDGPQQQSTGQTRPGETQDPLTATRRSHWAGQTAAAVAVAPRKSTARPFNLPHNPRETEFHVSVAELLDWILLPPAMFTTFPAGWGKLGKATAGRLKASGMKKGMPDILVFGVHRMIAHRTYTNVIGIELKVGDNSVNSAQRGMFAQLQAVGIRTYVCRNIEDVVRALADANIPYRKTDLSRKLEMAAQLDMSL
jgi:hypothetical protein